MPIFLALDEKIELNQKMNQTLEKIARQSLSHGLSTLIRAQRQKVAPQVFLLKSVICFLMNCGLRDRADSKRLGAKISVTDGLKLVKT